ncbi:MAG: hypothetical protein V3V08_04050 [Nannocystaceae bacterium]
MSKAKLIERQHLRETLTRKRFSLVGRDAGGTRASLISQAWARGATAKTFPEACLADIRPRLAPWRLSVGEGDAII